MDGLKALVAWHCACKQPVPLSWLLLVCGGSDMLSSCMQAGYCTKQRCNSSAHTVTVGALSQPASLTLAPTGCITQPLRPGLGAWFLVCMACRAAASLQP